ncbi:hypothetical protein V500_01760 [Pseudogymnoascus sp. VKM F-4518 (FW-2643)]|nr:hypothetical protein V500_01760 [Pseudogymnoascus sp. VKM F-4518 (FW-2643)]
MEATANGTLAWSIEKSGDGYRLSVRGNPVTVIKGLLFAVLTGDPEPEEWVIKAQPQHGKGVYTVETARGGVGWIAPDNENEQILVRPLIVGPSIPPYYPRNELFQITPI